MENKNIILLHRHFIDYKNNFTVYQNQVDDSINNYILIDVTSHVRKNKAFIEKHPGFEKDLSPFFIGPVVSSDGVTANIFEIFWQCGKVYPCHDNNGQPTEEFFKWRNEFYKRDKASGSLMRHACKDLGYENKDCRYFAYYDKEQKKYIPLGYVESRKKVYIREYAKLVANTESFKWLKSLVDSGKKIALLDFDGFNYYSYKGMKKLYEGYVNKCEKNKRPVTVNEEAYHKIKTIKDAINCPFLPVGHGFVIKMLLEEDIKVVNGEVVDENQILD